MIKVIFSFLNRNISGLHQTAYILGFSAFLSQVLALLRDRLLAHSFGAGETLDIYYAAFRIPDFIFIAVASLVSISVLVPLLAKEKNEQSGKKLMSEIFSVFLFLILIVCGITFFLIPKIVPLLFGSFSLEAQDQVILLSRVLLLSPILLGLSNFFTSIVQVHQKFVVYAVAPLLYNIGIIIGILLFYPMWGIKGLVFGVVLGACFHLAIQLPTVFRLRYFPKVTFVNNFKKIKRIISLSLPRTLALSCSNLSLLFLVSLASSMGEGSVSVFIFAYTLQSVPLSIIGTSYSVAAFPTLSRLFIEEKIDDFVSQINAATRHIVFWATIILVLFIVLRAQIVRTILGSGKFNWTDTRLTAACLAGFALSVTAQSLVILFIRGYYAANKTIKPVLAGVFSAICIVGLAFLFRWLLVEFPSIRESLGSIFRIEDIQNIDVLLLPLSFTLGNCLNAVILWFMFQKDFRKFSISLKKTIFQVGIATVIMGIITYFSLNLWSYVLDINTLLGIFLQGFLSGITGLIVLVVSLKLLKNEEIEEITTVLTQKLRG